MHDSCSNLSDISSSSSMPKLKRQLQLAYSWLPSYLMVLLRFISLNPSLISPRSSKTRWQPDWNFQRRKMERTRIYQKSKLIPSSQNMDLVERTWILHTSDSNGIARILGVGYTLTRATHVAKSEPINLKEVWERMWNQTYLSVTARHARYGVSWTSEVSKNRLSSIGRWGEQRSWCGVCRWSRMKAN